MGTSAVPPRFGAILSVAVIALLLVGIIPSYQGVQASTNESKVQVGPNIDISNEPGPQIETAIAINPTNPSQILAVSIDSANTNTTTLANGRVRAYFSSDGGATWGSTLLPMPPVKSLDRRSVAMSSFDPSVAWDSSGHVFVSTFVWFFDPLGNQTASEMVVHRSSDGGRSWKSTFFSVVDNGIPTVNLLGAEGTWIAVDSNPSSPFRDNVYVTFGSGNITSCTKPLFFSRSTDHGMTFSSPIVLRDGGCSFQASEGFTVGEDGTVYVPWIQLAPNELAFRSSTDGGLTFGPVVGITHLSKNLVSHSIPSTQWGSGLVVALGCGADRSSGEHRGTVYCVWVDWGGVGNGLDIFVSHSTDHGATWSNPVLVNDDPRGAANDQFEPALSVDPTNGWVSVSWYDTRNDPTHVSMDAFYAVSKDGGLTFSPNVQVTTAPTNESCCGAFTLFGIVGFFGDYQGIAAFGGVAHPVWTDRRASVLSLGEEIFTASISLN